MYIATDQYQAYKATPVYRYYQTVDTWYVPAVYTRYKVYTNGLAPARMKARVEVCTSVEVATRPNLCTRFPDGNYKPTGQVQVNSVASRLSAFGYVMENARTRYGGVLRAPMRFLGPQYRDTAGVMQNNASSEWNVNNGVFTTDPLNAAPTFARSGLINYLNKFGSTGVYKSFDPVGELYYEALRYFQGLPPTAGAASGLTTAMYDSFPVYNNVVSATSTVAGWTDPIQNACQRKNFIMVIGDVNTHNDRQLPGHGGSMVTTEDPARAVETVPGGTNTFDASYWTSLITGFETAGNVSYNDAKGIARNTLGNPNVVASNTTLQSKGTGSGSNSAYYWAGAAYWANTQPIRKDLKAGESLKEVRVKTFTIDVDENGNGTIDSNAGRGIAPRNSSFFLAGKYGWFNDANLDGSPFKTSGGLINNQEWEDPDVPNTPDGYVIASQAQKLVDAIEKFFKATSLEKGAVSVSSLSSQRFTTQEPNGDLFAPRFDTRD
ncbi:MAG TPA: hypothetical protein VGP24_16285, partial [Glaciihabitans sp.]|nr:hypothetical protein [Glaciihabitans sp.]